MKGSSLRIEALLDRKGRQLYWVSPETSVYSAIEQMASRGIGSLVVLQDGRLEGVFSERDYSRKVILAGRSSRDTEVREIMSCDCVTIAPSNTVEEGLRLMTDYKVRHLPVLSGDEVVGIVSIGDLVKEVIAEQEATITQLNSYITGTYPS
jgi:CBS domain-containing protein